MGAFQIIYRSLQDSAECIGVQSEHARQKILAFGKGQECLDVAVLDAEAYALDARAAGRKMSWQLALEVMRHQCRWRQHDVLRVGSIHKDERWMPYVSREAKHIPNRAFAVEDTVVRLQLPPVGYTPRVDAVVRGFGSEDLDSRIQGPLHEGRLLEVVCGWKEEIGGSHGLAQRAFTASNSHRK